MTFSRVLFPKVSMFSLYLRIETLSTEQATVGRAEHSVLRKQTEPGRSEFQRGMNTNTFAVVVSSIAHTVYSQDTNESCTGRSEGSRASYSRDEEQYLELHQEKESLLRDHPTAGERNENTNRLIKKIQDRMRKIASRLRADVENVSKPTAAKTAAERKREQRRRTSDSERHREKKNDGKRKRRPGGDDDTLDAGRYDIIHYLRSSGIMIIGRSRISSCSHEMRAEETGASGHETTRYEIIFTAN